MLFTGAFTFWRFHPAGLNKTLFPVGGWQIIRFKSAASADKRAAQETLYIIFSQ
ncbi:hypothetical protein [Microbulbifer sp.]|uniref:hypothetical protein n=1 Tax=Microbulbifer sp. TaxID=1908541 RepID=UPI002F926DCA